MNHFPMEALAQSCDILFMEYCITLQVVPEAIEKYKQAAKREVNVVINSRDFLPDDQIGVEAVEAKGRRIRVMNTLDSRLETVKDTKMPEIRQKLFPKSKPPTQS